MLKVKKYAFTLAEVLVTLMIIGVIAAMTIPGLKKNTEETAYISGVKKAFSTMAQATKMVELEHGDYKRWRFKDGSDAEVQRMFDWYKKHMNVIEECAPGAAGCWEQSYYLNNTALGTAVGIGGNTISFITADGMLYCFDGIGASSWGVNEPSGTLGIFVDTNGKKKPNKLGLDVHLFIMSKTRGLVPGGVDSPDMCKDSGTGNGCTYYVIKNSKIDY